MVKSIDSVTRAIHVLETLKKAPQALTLSELKNCTNINKATLLRILKTLIINGWVIKSLSENRYSVSSSTLEDILPKSQEARLAEAANPILESLYYKLNLPSDISIRDGDRMKLVETTRDRHSFLTTKLSQCRPEFLYSGIGRCYLAFCEEEERLDIIKKLKQLKSKEGKLAQDAEWLNQMINNTRTLGYGIRQSSYYNHQNGNGLLIEAIAVPIKKHDQKLIGCLSLAWSSESVKRIKLENEILFQLKEAAQEISNRMP
ncbi:IclR family transcriptional regulator domain-containing protein [Marinomonas sp. BSi20584]|uniref:IclR family transcriptional regulator domain-containing protein n=1 Tax=Marinomonas sp. BSi20584 TaxID=1594462 RepID=UPI000CAA238C|nr:IclR family transcriptional regulator C-terminal domain-containing protein [Marinomonas sp. BSi20584]PJE53215.1 hypothetical protein TY87_21965 [Marinomonas sp. BSi20584]